TRGPVPQRGDRPASPLPPFPGGRAACRGGPAPAGAGVTHSYPGGGSGWMRGRQGGPGGAGRPPGGRGSGGPSRGPGGGRAPGAPPRGPGGGRGPEGPRRPAGGPPSGGRPGAGRPSAGRPAESRGPEERRGPAGDRRPSGPRPPRSGAPSRSDRPFRPGDRSRGPARPRDGAPRREGPRNGPRDDSRRPPKAFGIITDTRPSPQPAPVPLVPPPVLRIPPGARLAGVDVLELRVEKLVAGGDGLGRWEGVPIFIPRAAPGDLLKVRIVERRPDYGRAEIVEILEAGPARRPDPVPELSRSSICDLQHLDDLTQVLLKAGAVKETLEHIGKIAMPHDPELITGEPWHYRLRTQLHTAIDPLTGAVLVGYHARGTNEVIPVTRCPLLVPELETFLAELPSLLSSQASDAPKRLDLAVGDSGVVTVSPVVPGLQQGEVSTKVGDFTYFYDSRCFFQAHRGLLPKPVEATVGPWEGETA